MICIAAIADLLLRLKHHNQYCKLARVLTLAHIFASQKRHFCQVYLNLKMAPNRLQENQQQMGDAIYEFQLHDSIYRLNTHAQLKVVARKAEPKPKVRNFSILIKIVFEGLI